MEFLGHVVKLFDFFMKSKTAALFYILPAEYEGSVFTTYLLILAFLSVFNCSHASGLEVVGIPL